MNRSRVLAVALLASCLIPGTASAATLLSARTLVIAEPPLDNLYLTGTDITVVAPLPADLMAAAGTISVSGAVAGDAFLGAGTVSVLRPIAGDLRAVGGQVLVNAPVTGDLMLAGGSVTASSSARSTHIIGGSVGLHGSNGPAKVYGADVTLSGEFNGDVEVVASDRLTLEEGTVIHGALKYDAPQQVSLPATAVIDNGVTYTGASSYLPTIEEAKTFAIAGASVFFVVRILAVLIAAGLLAGLFPAFSQRVADRALSYSPRRFVLLALLGFAIVIAAPVLILLLLVSFVGIGVAFLLGIAYLMLLMLGYLFAGILAGAALARGVFKRYGVTWKFAILGMLVLGLVGAIPVLGPIVTSVLFFAATGAIVAICYGFAFGKDSADDSLDLPLMNQADEA